MLDAFSAIAKVNSQIHTAISTTAHLSISTGGRHITEDDIAAFDILTRIHLGNYESIEVAAAEQITLSAKFLTDFMVSNQSTVDVNQERTAYGLKHLIESYYGNIYYKGYYISEAAAVIGLVMAGYKVKVVCLDVNKENGVLEASLRFHHNISGKQMKVYDDIRNFSHYNAEIRHYISEFKQFMSVNDLQSAIDRSSQKLAGLKEVLLRDNK